MFKKRRYFMSWSSTLLIYQKYVTRVSKNVQTIQQHTLGSTNVSNDFSCNFHKTTINCNWINKTENKQKIYIHRMETLLTNSLINLIKLNFSTTAAALFLIMRYWYDYIEQLIFRRNGNSHFFSELLQLFACISI